MWPRTFADTGTDPILTQYSSRGDTPARIAGRIAAVAASNAVTPDARALLQQHLAEGAEAAALAVWRAATHGDAAAWADATGAIADATDLDPRLRVAALLAAALLAQRGAPVTDAALRALGDDALLDAALDAGASAAITGIAAAAGPRLGDDDRRYLAQRLAASGAIGEHIAALHVAVGNLDAAAAATAAALIAVLAAHGPTSLAAQSVAHLTATWVAQLGAQFGETIAAALPAATCTATAAAARSAGSGHHHPLIVALENRAAAR